MIALLPPLMSNGGGQFTDCHSTSQITLRAEPNHASQRAHHKGALHDDPARSAVTAAPSTVEQHCDEAIP